MNRQQKKAAKSSKKRYELTAYIYDKRGRLLSVGKNSYVKTHPRQKRYAIKAGQPDREFLHAEVDAIIKCRGTPYKIVIERVDQNGNQQLAKPCPVCEIAIKKAGIQRVEYTV